MPQFGRLDTNIYYMQGYSGHGVTCTHLAGRLISELLRGDAERFDAFAKLPHYPFPGGAACAFRLPPWGRHITAYAIALGFKFFRNKPDAQGGLPCAFFYSRTVKNR